MTSEMDMGNLDDWRRFKEVGLLDEAAMVRKDHQALAEKLTKLETQVSAKLLNKDLLFILMMNCYCHISAGKLEVELPWPSLPTSTMRLVIVENCFKNLK